MARQAWPPPLPDRFWAALAPDLRALGMRVVELPSGRPQIRTCRPGWPPYDRRMWARVVAARPDLFDPSATP